MKHWDVKTSVAFAMYKFQLVYNRQCRKFNVKQTITSVLAILVIILISPEPVSAANELWRSWEPRVIEHDGSQSATLTVVVDSEPAVVELALTTSGGCFGAELESLQLSSTGANTYVITLTPEQLLRNYIAGDAHARIGCLKVDGNPQHHQNINVRNENMTGVEILEIATGVQASDNILNIVDDELLLGGHPSEDLLSEFYLYLEDEYDFIAVIDQVDTTNNRSYSSRRNDIEGIGRGIYDSTPTVPPRFRGTIIFPIDSYFDLGQHVCPHEIGHQWINFLDGKMDDPRGSHWPLSGVAYGIMGFSSQSGVGLNFPYSLEERPDGNYNLIQQSPAKEFNDLELYLMGLIGPEEVSEHIVFTNQDQLANIPSRVLQGPVDHVTINDIIATNGMRLPTVDDAQKDFSIATIVLSKDRLLNEAEMAFFDHMASRGSSRVPLTIYSSGMASPDPVPFYLATGGRATLSTSIVSSSPKICSGVHGCTPGYWKQLRHEDSWMCYSMDDSFDEVFGVNSTFSATTLAEVLAQGGGGEKALGRHAVSALLNACMMEYDSGFEYCWYPYEVINAVGMAYETGDFEFAKNRLESVNEKYCPLN